MNTKQKTQVQVFEGEGQEPDHWLDVTVIEKGDEYEPFPLLVEWRALSLLRYSKDVVIPRISFISKADGFEYVGMGAVLVQDGERIVVHVDKIKLGTMA